MAFELLTVEQMRQAEQLAFAGGDAGYAMMERAGAAVAQCVARRYPGRPVAVLAGGGNNGGDGYVAARMLREAGHEVRVFVGAPPATPDAARAAADYAGESYPLASLTLEGGPVVLDALFGIGLARKIEGQEAAAIGSVNASGLPVVAVDVPSGIEGNSGAIAGMAVRATLTVTFGACKPAHLLLPGRLYAGELLIADIGLAPGHIAGVKPFLYENTPALWRGELPWPAPQMHKYQRGRVMALAGDATRAGAARLAAISALRAGAGLAGIICEDKDVPLFAASALSLMTERRANWKKLLTDDSKKNTYVIGPGSGVGATTRAAVVQALKQGRKAVLDADALTSFAEHQQELFGAVGDHCVLTPHGGEFRTLFPMLGELDKLAAARKAAEMSNAIVVHKGFDTVIAEPRGRVAINSNAPPALATAGAGDVLAGIIAGLMAQGMPAFEAACAAVWIHAEAAALQPFGLIAEDLPGRLPEILQRLR